MAKSIKNPYSVGIKELKDQASSVVQLVRDTGKAVVITKNNQAIARIEPLRNSDPFQRLNDLGLVSSTSKQKWSKLVLEGPAMESRLALESLLKDRESD